MRANENIVTTYKGFELRRIKSDTNISAKSLSKLRTVRSEDNIAYTTLNSLDNIQPLNRSEKAVHLRDVFYLGRFCKFMLHMKNDMSPESINILIDDFLGDCQFLYKQSLGVSRSSDSSKSENLQRSRKRSYPDSPKTSAVPKKIIKLERSSAGESSSVSGGEYDDAVENEFMHKYVFRFIDFLSEQIKDEDITLCENICYFVVFLGFRKQSILTNQNKIRDLTKSAVHFVFKYNFDKEINRLINNSDMKCRVNRLYLSVNFQPYLDSDALAFLSNWNPKFLCEFFTIEFNSNYRQVDLEDVFYDRQPYDLARYYLLFVLPKKIAVLLHDFYCSKVSRLVTDLLHASSLETLIVFCQRMNIPVPVNEYDFQTLVGFSGSENCRQVLRRADLSCTGEFRQLLNIRERMRQEAEDTLRSRTLELLPDFLSSWLPENLEKAVFQSLRRRVGCDEMVGEIGHIGSMNELVHEAIQRMDQAIYSYIQTGPEETE